MKRFPSIRMLALLTLLLPAGAGPGHAGSLEDGDAHLKARRVSEAEAAYTQALAETPGSVRALVGRGRARQGLENKEGAAADFDQAVKLAPENVEALRYRAHFRELAVNDYRGAIDDYLYCDGSCSGPRLRPAIGGGRRARCQ